MSVCPWCQAEVTEPRFPCRSCGKRPKDHVSYQRLAAVQASAPAPVAAPAPAFEALELGEATLVVNERGVHERGSPDDEQTLHVPQPAPDLDIPDLMPTAPRRPPPTPAAAPAHAMQELSLNDPAKPPSLLPPAPPKPKTPKHAAPAASSFDDGIDGMESDAGGSIDLAAPEWARGGGGGAAPAAAAVAVTKAVSRILESEDGGKAEAEKLGAYGPVPDEVWKAPIYAYRVKMRQLQIRRELLVRRADLEKAQAKGDDALVALAERGRKVAEGHAPYAKQIEAVLMAESTLRDRDSALAAETEAHRKETSGLDAQIEQHEAQIAGARAEERSYQGQFDRVDAVRQRAEAKMKRVDIDLRGVLARVTAAGGGGAAGAAAAASDPEVVAKTAERAARQDEVEQSMPAVTEATQKLTVARRKVADIDQRILGVRNTRADLEEKFKKRGAAHGVEVMKAQAKVREAMVAMGKVMAEDFATFGVEWTEARKELSALNAITAARDDAVILHAMALDAHDGETVKKGLGIAGGIAALLCLILVLPMVLGALTAKPAPRAPPTTIEPE